MGKYNIGTMNFRDYRGHAMMSVGKWAYTTKAEATKLLNEMKAFSKKFNRNETYIILRDKVKSGPGKGKTVYVVYGRGKARR